MVAAMVKSARKPARRRLSPAEKARIEEIFHRFLSEEDDPRTELNYDSPYTLVVAVALSAQATDVSVNKATARLFEVAHTPQDMLALGEEGLIPYIASIGLYRTKAKNVIAAAKIIMEQHGGEVPLDRAALQALPGVGRKTANVVLNVAFGEPTMAVDTHIFRVANRTGLAPGKDPLAVEQALLARVPPAYRRDAHHWLILHGRYVCLARTPRCAACSVQRFCAEGPSRIAAGAAATAAGLLSALTTLRLDVGPLPHVTDGPASSLDPEANGVQRLVFSGETAEGQHFDCFHLHEDDLATQTRYLRISYETHAEDGLVRRRVSEHQLRYVYRFELEYLLDAAGLVLSDIYGDYDLGPLTNDSERMIAIARRREG